VFRNCVFSLAACGLPRVQSIYKELGGEGVEHKTCTASVDVKRDARFRSCALRRSADWSVVYAPYYATRIKTPCSNPEIKSKNHSRSERHLTVKMSVRSTWRSKHVSVRARALPPYVRLHVAFYSRGLFQRMHRPPQKSVWQVCTYITLLTRASRCKLHIHMSKCRAIDSSATLQWACGMRAPASGRKIMKPSRLHAPCRSFPGCHNGLAWLPDITARTPTSLGSNARRMPNHIRCHSNGSCFCHHFWPLQYFAAHALGSNGYPVR